MVCLAPAQVKAIRAWLIERDKLYAATIVSLVAYQGLRIPEEVLALEVRHVRANTLLVEQRNIKGRIVATRRWGTLPRGRPGCWARCAAK